MRTDYKINYVIQNTGTEVKATFYEGDFEDVVIEGKTIKTYRRIKALRSAVFKFPELLEMGEIQKRINRELKKDTGRTPIEEQTITL